MIKHGGSHGLAVLVCSLTAGFMIGVIRTYIPEALYITKKISVVICRFFHLPCPPESFEVVLIISIMATVWGMAFSYMHGDRKK